MVAILIACMYCTARSGGCKIIFHLSDEMTIQNHYHLPDDRSFFQSSRLSIFKDELIWAIFQVIFSTNNLLPITDGDLFYGSLILAAVYANFRVHASWTNIINQPGLTTIQWNITQKFTEWMALCVIQFQSTRDIQCITFCKHMYRIHNALGHEFIRSRLFLLPLSVW